MEEFVGKVWDRFVTGFARRDFPQAMVALPEMERSVTVMFRALGGGGGLRLVAAAARAHGSRRSWRERLAGIGTHSEFAYRDGEALHLPATIAVFPERALNRELYLWLAALAAVDNCVPETWFIHNQNCVSRALATFPGLRPRYARLVAAHLALRPDPARLPVDEAGAELAVRAALERPGLAFDLPPARHTPAPVPLWLHPVTARTTVATPPDGSDSAATSGGAVERDLRRRQAEHVEMPDGRDGLIVFRLESMFSIGEYVPAKRATDEGDADAAHADDFDTLSIARDDTPVASRVRFDLDLPAAEQDDAPLGDGVLLPEWDYRRQALLSDHCRVQPLIAARTVACRLPPELRSSARRLRRQFEALAPARHWQSRRPDGSEPDLDAWLRYSAERARGLTVSTPDLYRDLARGRRDLACLLLADLSLSTDSWVGERRIVDVIRDALFLFSEALSATGDRFALYGFSSRRREHVRFHHLKGFDEAYSDAVRGRITAIKPGFYTRMGAAIRRAATILSGESAGQRLLLILTDGKPNDLDRYEGRYGIEDTRHAVLEARRAGLLPFCITVDEEGADYLPHLFGAGSFVVLRRPDDLPRELPPLYARLTRAP